MFAASLAGAGEEAQTASDRDLLVAELAGLDLDDEDVAEEATRPPYAARQRLSSAADPPAPPVASCSTAGVAGNELLAPRPPPVASWSTAGAAGSEHLDRGHRA